MRQSEMKRKYDPELGRRVKKHIYGEGIMDIPKVVSSIVMGKTTKDLAKKAATKAAEKAGDKIIEMLSKQSTHLSDTSRVNQLIAATKYKIV